MSDFISILFGLAELLCQRDFSTMSYNESKAEKKRQMWYVEKRLITKYKCGCAYPPPIEIFKCSQILIPCRITLLFTIFPNFMKSFALTSAVFTNVSTPYIKIRCTKSFYILSV